MFGVIKQFHGTIKMGTAMIAAQTLQRICEHLADRNLVLFTGAGINAKIANKSGANFPLGVGLSQAITSQLLGDLTLELPLVEAAEIAEHKLTRRALNSFIYDQIKRFSPGIAHSLISGLPFHSIYTTNYDTLMEQAFAATGVGRKLMPIWSNSTDLSYADDETLPYYKLHGSIDVANTDEGRIVITHRDYDFYIRYRKKLFRRLSADIATKAFLFIGYSISDDNIITLINDCRDQLEIATLPKSYAIQRSASPLQIAYWRDKYNIEIIETDVVEALASISETFVSFGGSSAKQAGVRSNAELLQIDSSASLPIFANSFYILDPDRCSGAADPVRFFRGGEPRWADIREKVPPNRDAYETLSSALLEDAIRTDTGAQLYLVTGHAGTGKTTLVRACVFQLVADLGISVYFHIAGSPIDCRVFSPVHNPDDPRRIIVVFPSAALVYSDIARFAADAKSLNLPISIVMEERTNQWTSTAAGTAFGGKPTTITLDRLSEAEIDRILDALTKYNCLEKIVGFSREEQRRHFAALADKELLVALRELTQQTSFDTIIKDEFIKIPTPEGQKAYLYAACVGQIDLALLYSNVMRITGVAYGDLETKIFKATDGVLMSGEVRGNSRYNEGFKVTTRHPVIASIIFAIGAPTDEAKYNVINDIITFADPGYPEDRLLLREITRKRELVETMTSPQIRRAVYDRLMEILPDDPYVFQHRSILERDLDNAGEAIRFAQKAIQYGSAKPIFMNTLAYALEARARETENPVQRRAYLDQAEKIFREGIDRHRYDAFPYVGLARVLRCRAEFCADETMAALLRAEIVTTLQSGIEATDGDSMIVAEVSKYRDGVYDKGKLFIIVSEGLKAKPNDSHLRGVLVSLHLENGNRKQALEVAFDGTKMDPTAWRLHRHCARLQRQFGAGKALVSSHYASAIRHNSNDIALRVEFGEFLFTSADYEAASAVFDECRPLRNAGTGQNPHAVSWVRTPDDRKKIHDGVVEKVVGNAGFILATPENYRTRYFRQDVYSMSLRPGEKVTYELGFNSYGALAKPRRV